MTNPIEHRTIKTFLSISLFSVFFLISCSNQKNTTATRAYHDLTAHYNVLFNGEQSFEKGLKKIDESFKDDYTRILPVFTYENDDIAKAIGPDMDRAIKKGTKLITLHSIKAKPAYKKGRMTPPEKAFYNKSEYNKWVPDAYLLIGKAHFYKHEYHAATETFNFVTQEFAKQPAQYEAMIWLARIYSETKEYKDAERILTSLEGDQKFPSRYRLQLYTSMADVVLKQDEYTEAVAPLKKALALARTKKDKLRYSYILAQLYQQNKQYRKATAMYTKIIHKSPPYEMSFNARINLAATVESGTKNSEYIKTQLMKMLRDDKNSDYLDQIYFALGNIAFRNHDEPKAIEYYKKSVALSTKNQEQKGLSCITLANLYYSKKIYIPSEAYYDTAMQNITTAFPDYPSIKAKSDNLNHLVENLNTITREDSLQRIAKLPEAQRLAVINGIIENLRKKEMEQKQAESQGLEEYYANQNNKGLLDQSAKAKWYFYNPVSVAEGIRDFQLRWGKRRLEDNWQRRNKSVIAFENDNSESDTTQRNTKPKEKEKTVDNKSIKFYAQNLPTNDSLMKVSMHKEITAYFNAGQVYRNELHDTTQAVAIYEEMLRRFPDNEYKLPVCYQQYLMYSQLRNYGRAAYYKNLLINKYPGSKFAKILEDPDYYRQMLLKSRESDDFYETTFNMYQSGNYTQVIENANTAISKYKNDPVLPKFALLKAMAVAKTGNVMAFRDDLNKIVTQYPKDSVSLRAKELIAYLNQYKPETKVQEDIKIAKITYLQESKPTYYFGLVISNQEDINQIVFDIINFNLDNFPTDHFQLSNEALGSSFKIILVKAFDDQKKAMAFYNKFSANTNVLKNVKQNVHTEFIISPDNLKILEKQVSADSYSEFFKMNYLSKP